MSGVVDIAYDAAYLAWVLGPTHPTNAIRARLATHQLLVQLPEAGIAARIVMPVASSVATLCRVHDDDYVLETMRGDNHEWWAWGEPRPELGVVASLMCGGTEVLARRILTGQTRVGFNPQGAKHHAHYDRGGGFCVFNDIAVATDLFVRAGWRVAYIDIDAHHGDGVEAMLRGHDGVLTASIHQSQLFPGTGLESDASSNAYNRPLPPGSGDERWVGALLEAIDLVTAFQPDVVIAAIGADAHETDPLSSLKVTAAGYSGAGDLLGALVEGLAVPILIGGAGGYQPETWTPRIWADVVTRIARGAARGPSSSA